MITDTAYLLLRNKNLPYIILDSSKSILDSGGTGIFTFNNSSISDSFFIVIKHRNSIETWSKTAQSFTNYSLTYDFTNAVSKAYGDNMINVDNSPVRYAIYSGNVNQDNSIDLEDVLMIYNDALNFNTGYVNTDTNGDYLTDLSDLIITYNNSNLFIGVINP